MHLFIHEIGHLVFYLFGAFLVYLVKPKYLNYKSFFVGLFITFFMDADHLIDYLISQNFDFLSISIKGFFSGGYFSINQKVFVFFHAWEYVVAIFAIYFLFIKDKIRFSWIFFLGYGMLIHLTWDVLSYGFNPMVYFIFFRIIFSFNISIFDNMKLSYLVLFLQYI